MPSLRIAVIAPEDSRYLQHFIDDVKQVDPAIEIVRHHEEIETSATDLLVMIVQADRGVSQSEIASFNDIRERQLPGLVLVASLMPTDGLPLAEDRWDFDDIAMLINRTIEKPVTPFLVLHDDEGLPIALYDLANDQVINYISGKPEILEGDEELREVVRDFKDEFEEEDFSIEDFTSGLRVIALPYIPERAIGSDELIKLLSTLQQVHS